MGPLRPGPPGVPRTVGVVGFAMLWHSLGESANTVPNGPADCQPRGFVAAPPQRPRRWSTASRARLRSMVPHKRNDLHGTIYGANVWFADATMVPHGWNHPESATLRHQAAAHPRRHRAAAHPLRHRAAAHPLRHQAAARSARYRDAARLPQPQEWAMVTVMSLPSRTRVTQPFPS
jgi:hypothetical protein